MVPVVPAVRAALGKAVSARLVLRAKVPLAGLAVRALRVERPDKARRVASVLPVVRVQVARVLPPWMVLEVVSVLPAALALVDRVPAKAVSVRLVPEAKVRRGARRKSHPPRHRNPPPRISLDIR